jgi:hypothetical protein
MTRYQRLRRAIAGRPVNRYLTPAELQRAQRARQAVEEDRAASQLPWRWVIRAAVVVIPLTVLAQALAHRLGCITC